MKNKSANGVKGFLLFNTFTGEPFFRVYDKTDKSNFKDYDLKHTDLQVVINDSDAYFYENNNGDLFLDYSPETLGYK